MVGGRGDNQLHCWPLQGAILVCYGWGGRVTTNFGGVDVVPLLCHCRAPISVSYLPSISRGHQFHLDTQENNNGFCLELLADVTRFSTLVKQKLFFAIWGLCWYNFYMGDQVYIDLDAQPSKKKL